MDAIETDFNAGERAIANAPRLTLSNGQRCIPQHYLQYAHTLESVEALVSNISFCDKYPIFISEDSGGLILQIGIIGYDNYKPATTQPKQKIVFGRKWRVERNLPSSEIIQTAFLAIKKAREHEIRELFTFSYRGKTTTPFNNHHDLPLMARNADIINRPAVYSFNAEIGIEAIKFDGGSFHISDYETLRNELTAMSLTFIPKVADTHIEFAVEPIVLLLKSVTSNTVYHALMSEMIARSDAFVDETFHYRGFARFSADNIVLAIAKLSADLRQNPKNLLDDTGHPCSFTADFAAERYDTDLTRVPQLTHSPYGQKLHETLSEMKLANFDMLLAAQEEG